MGLNLYKCMSIVFVHGIISYDKHLNEMTDFQFFGSGIVCDRS